MTQRKIIRAKSAGFCFGVKRAVETVQREVSRQADEPNKKIYTYGPIIHNDYVVSSFEKQGVKVINSADDLEAISEGTVIIRSHGVSRQVYRKLSDKGLRVVDATCPYVKKIHNIVAEQSSKGSYILIIGNDTHPEVEGIKGWVSGDVRVISEKKEAMAFTADPEQLICIVAQTTFNLNKFKDLVEIVSKKGYDILVLNTICGATGERQREADKIASEVDVMIVIGDSRSSNTRKLFEICKAKCERTYHVQTAEDLRPAWLTDIRSIGITAGASTPHNIIEEVQNKCQI